MGTTNLYTGGKSIMVWKIGKECSCLELGEQKINSYDLFEKIKNFFKTNDDYEEIPVTETLKIKDNKGNIITQWYPTKWFKCKTCENIWAFDYPDFPAQGSLYKLGDDRNPVNDSIFYFENRKKRKL